MPAPQSSTHDESQQTLDRLLAAPDLHYTRIRGNKRWHLALTELWLQRLRMPPANPSTSPGELAARARPRCNPVQP